MCEIEKKTVQFRYDTGLLQSVTAPANLAGSQNTNFPSEIFYFTSQLEAWRILDVTLGYTLIPTIVPDPKGTLQDTLYFSFETDFIINGQGNVFERGIIENQFKINNGSTGIRKMVFTKELLQFDFSKGHLVAQGVSNFKTWFFCRTSGTNTNGINISFYMTFNLERMPLKF